MIVSHEYGFVFMHSRKVAGSSIKVALAPYLGRGDVVIGSWNEILDSGVSLTDAASRALRHPKAYAYYLAARGKGKSVNDAINIGIKAYYRGSLSANPPHPTAKEASDFFHQEWRNYFKFSFVRNPWERVASDYYWRRRMTSGDFDFRDYLYRLRDSDCRGGILHPGGASNWEMIADDGKIAVDYVGRYEQIQEDFRAICSKLGVPNEIPLVTKKMNTDRPDYGGLYGTDEKELVQKMFAPEIEYFGYAFPY